MATVPLKFIISVCFLYFWLAIYINSGYAAGLFPESSENSAINQEITVKPDSINETEALTDKNLLDEIFLQDTAKGKDIVVSPDMDGEISEKPDLNK